MEYGLRIWGDDGNVTLDISDATLKDVSGFIKLNVTTNGNIENVPATPKSIIQIEDKTTDASAVLPSVVLDVANARVSVANGTGNFRFNVRVLEV